MITPRNIPFARMSAESYYSVGKSLYSGYHSIHMNRILKVAERPQQDGLIKFAIPSMVNLTLALELYLKVLVFQHGVQTILIKHDILKFFQLLPAATRDSINNSFLHKYNEDLQLLIEFKIDGVSTFREPKSKYDKITKFLKDHRNSFVDWRYFHEIMEKEESSFFSFKGMIYTIDVLREHSFNYQGDMRSSLKIGP